MCGGKRAFIDPTQARRARRETRNYTSRRLTVYKCKDCGIWHLATYSELSRVDRIFARRRHRRVA